MRELRKITAAARTKSLVFWSAICAIVLAGGATGLAFAGRLKQFALIIYIAGGVALAAAIVLTVVYSAFNSLNYRWAIDGDGVEKRNGFLIRRTSFMPHASVERITVRPAFPAKAELVRVTFAGGGHKLVLRDAPRAETLAALENHFGEVYAREDV